MTSPDDTSEGRRASSGATRTPPPRPRRGAPTTRPSVEDLDARDPRGPEPTAALAEPQPASKPKPKPKPSNRSSSRTTPSRARSTTTNREATVPAVAAEGFGDPLEPEISFEPGPVDRPRTKAAKRPERRFRQTVQKIDLWSVTKMALCFYVSAMGVVVVSLVALWVVADSAGIIDNVENFIGDLFSSDDFQFVSGEVLRGAVLIGVVLVALMVAFTIIAASFYNIFAELFGGVEVIIREEEQPPKR